MIQHHLAPTCLLRSVAPSGARGLLFLLVALLTLTTFAPPATALVRFDFEQEFYRHPGRQVWDFSMVRVDSVYHIFYHTIAESTPNAAYADTIWQASSPDLKHWQDPNPILTVGQGPWDAGALWAPTVMRDEANNRWVLFYTGCDANMNQTICMAYSHNMKGWSKSLANPIVQPDTTAYIWDKQATWSNFRDPFLYRQDNMWHMLVTAKQDIGGNKGVIYHGISDDLENWTDVGPLFVNDGATPSQVLESCQYRVIGTTHHLLFGEFNTQGVTILSAADPSQWSMADRLLLDYGYAPEVNEFDPGVNIYSRIAPYYLPGSDTDLGYVVRIDTLRTDPDGSNPTIYQPHPLDANWIVHSGTMNLASPTFGDNPLWRGEPSVGVVGNSYFGTAEYYRGPLSGRGAPGSHLGDPVTGVAETYRFPLTGDRMELLVGGGKYPTTCYVALVDNDSGEVLYRETGTGEERMSLRSWDLVPFRGRTCYVTIVDQETGPQGHLNVDEITEIADPALADVRTPGASPTRHRAWPNPFNPQTTIGFDLPRAAACEVTVHDLRGHLVWRSGELAGQEGPNSVVWRGRDDAGRMLGAGTYLYTIEVAGVARAGGKVSLIK